MFDSKFIPRIPQPVPPLPPVTSPFSAVVTEKNETLASWLADMFKGGVKAIPQVGRQLAIQLGIVVGINLIFWPLQTWSWPTPISAIVAMIIFLTATYNNIIPKTIFWVIVFTFGKRLFLRIKREGIAKAIAPIREIVPEFRNAYGALTEKANFLLLLGCGVGLVVANNFASYSRFSGARNKIDKYFVALVISFAISYILGESKKGWLFKFGRLTSNDYCRLVKKQCTYSDNHTFLLLSGFVAGLLLDAPLILLNMMYGGYIFGGLCLLAGIIINFLPKVSKTR